MFLIFIWEYIHINITNFFYEINEFAFLQYSAEMDKRENFIALLSH